MNTRTKQIPGLISQERYMSSNEFAELRGVSGVAVSARAAVLLHAEKRDFIWFLQGLSLAEGGLKRVARELLQMFPDRIGTPAMHAAGVRPGKIYPGGIVTRVEIELKQREYLLNAEPSESKLGDALIKSCLDAATLSRETKMANGRFLDRDMPPSLEEFLIDLCINPRLCFCLPGEVLDTSEVESERAIENHRSLSLRDFHTANLIYFKDIIGALVEYKRRHEVKVRENFQLTAIGKKIFETLDYALASGGMVVLDGLEGRGKTEAVKAWCDLNLGRSRFVSLKGITSKTTAFREIAKALGIASSYTRTAPEMQARIEDVLKRSKLCLVVDEAHFVFNQSRRMYTRPELVDWIDTAVCNRGVPIALVTTPQFIVCMTRAADQVEWNYRQFRRRVKRWIKLPAANTEDDIRAVAKSIFKNGSAAMISKIVGYALLSKRDLSAVGDIADEVRVMLGTHDLSQATPDNINHAIYDHLLPSDQTFAQDMSAARDTGRKPGRKAFPVPGLVPAAPEDAAPEPMPASQIREAQNEFPPRREVAPADLAGSPRRSGADVPLVDSEDMFLKPA